MKIERPKKHIKPTPENRSELVEMIKHGLLQTNEQFTAALRQDQDSVNRYLAEKNASALPIAMGFLFFNSMGVAINSILNGNLSGWDAVNAAFSDMYWAWEIQHHDSIRQGISFDCPTQCETTQVVVHSLSLKNINSDISTWTASFLRNLIKMGGALEISYSDENFLNFYLYLLDCQIGNSFQPLDESKTYGKYYTLLNAFCRQEMLSESIHSYCDFRLARAFQFSEMGAIKPRSKSDYMYLYEQHWLAIFPFELYTLQSIYQNITNLKISLDVGHPLLSTQFSNPPRINLVKTKLSDEVINFGKDYFGDEWKPLSEIHSV